MQQGAGVIPCVRARLNGVLVLIVLLAPLHGEPSQAEASLLNDTVTPLRHGGGFRLQPPAHPFLSYPPSFIAPSLTGVDALRTRPPLPFGLFASNLPANRIVSDLGQDIPPGSIEGHMALLHGPLLLHDTGQPDMVWPSPRLAFAPRTGRVFPPPALTFPHAPLRNEGYLPAASLIQFKPTLGHIDVTSGNEARIFLPSPVRLTQTWDVRGIIPFSPMPPGVSLQAPIMSQDSLRNVGQALGSESGSFSLMASKDDLRSGAIILQTQYNFPRQAPSSPEFTVLSQITLPTRDKGPFLETQEPSFLALLMASQRFGWLAASMNFGFERTLGASAQNNISYGVGLNAQVHPTLTLVLDLLGRWTPMGNGFSDHMVDLTLGTRWNPLSTLFLEANLQRAITNSESLRSGITYTIRVNYMF